MDTKTVLVVEDNELNVKMFLAFLKIGNYRVLTAGDAETGILLANEHVPDLILMDIQLPDMDGLSATRLLKNNPKTKDIPIVALSAYAMDKDKRMSIEAGCAGHLSKPVELQTFLSFVEKYISGHEASSHQ